MRYILNIMSVYHVAPSTLNYTTQCCIMTFDCFEAETVQFCNSQNSNFENAAPWVICVYAMF